MALITRFSRLFRADLHAVLDRIEEPDVILRQAVREMEEEIGTDEQRYKLLQHELKQLGTRRNELTQTIARTQEELTICLDAENDELARGLLRRRLEAERSSQFIERKQAELSHAITELTARLEQNRQRFSAMQQKLELLGSYEREYAGEDVTEMPDFSVRDEDVEVALLREKQKRRES